MQFGYLVYKYTYLRLMVVVLLSVFIKHSSHKIHYIIKPWELSGAVDVAENAQALRHYFEE